MSRCLVLLAMLLFATGVKAQTDLGTVTVYGTTIDGQSVICEGTGCTGILFEYATGGYDLNVATISEGSLSITKNQFCSYLRSQQPGGCSLSNPPSTPTYDLSWQPNGCGDGSSGSNFLNALVAAAGDYTGGTGLNHPAAGVTFTSACNNHDRCYGSSGGKSTCDLNFRAEMRDICGASTNSVCGTIADAYYDAVKIKGDDAYNGSAAQLSCAAWSNDMQKNGCPS